MADLSDFKRSQIVGARMEGASVTKSTESFRLARRAVSKEMTEFEKERKTYSLKQNSEKKLKLSDRDRRTLMWIVRKDHENTALKIIAELYDHLEKPVCSKTLRRKRHKDGFHGRAAIRKPFLSQINIANCLEWRINLTELVPRTMEECDFLGRVILYLISDIWSIIGVETPKKNHLIQTAFFQLEKPQWWSGEGYTLEIWRPNGFPSWQDQKSRLFKNFLKSNSSYGGRTVT